MTSVYSKGVWAALSKIALDIIREGSRKGDPKFVCLFHLASIDRMTVIYFLLEQKLKKLMEKRKLHVGTYRLAFNRMGSALQRNSSAVYGATYILYRCSCSLANTLAGDRQI